MLKVKNNQDQGKKHTAESSCKTFQEKRNVSIQEVLNYELGALPLSISCADGGMVKSNKASLGGELKKIAPIETELSLDYISLFDDMAKLRSTDPHLVKYLIIF